MKDSLKQLGVVNEVELDDRKVKVKEELKKPKLNTEELKNLLLYDNTNEELIYRYIVSLDKEDVFDEFKKYWNFISVDKINALSNEIFGENSNQGFRKKSFKQLFYEPLIALASHNKNDFENKMKYINVLTNSRLNNNQPFDIDNFNALYFYFCYLLKKQIKLNEASKEKYIEGLETFLSSLQDLKKYSNNITFEEEDKDINKFLICIFAILNIDSTNIYEISQVLYVLNEPDTIKLNDRINYLCNEIADEPFSRRFLEDFKNIINKNKNNINRKIKYKIVDNKLNIPETCYRYDYIMANNLYKKYEKQLIDLLTIIYQSDLIKDLSQALYCDDGKNMKYFFNKKDSVKEFWHKIILFIPFKLKRVSGFDYREFFKIFISVYTICHFDSYLENEIFTLGSFVKTILHETIGHLFFSYKFFSFYSNIKNNSSFIGSPRMQDMIENLNKNFYINSIGKKLAEIYFGFITSNKKNKKDNEEDILANEFEAIIGNEYSKTISKQLLEDDEFINVDNISESNKSEKGKEKEKERVTLKLSNKIINLLFNCILEEFKKYLSNLEYNNTKYKNEESGNVAEFLLFGDFSQNITLKQCMFLLNEENYRNNNIFYFRSKYKNSIGVKNDEYLKKNKNESTIFKELFSEYEEKYHLNTYEKNDFTSPKCFRQNLGDNLNREYESFKCVFVKCLPTDLSGELNEN